MSYSTSKILVIGLAVCIVALLGPAQTAAATEDKPAEKTLQPQTLDYAGIYALRQIEPNLTGAGAKFAVICRSVTYTDGEPQNDYRPNTAHNCFANRQFGFHDQGELPAGISPHSTAICSILFGEDPNASNQQLGQFRYQGAVPHAHADIYEFLHFLINNVYPHSPPDADIVTVGIGSQFEDWWTRGIEALTEHHGTVVVAGIGNGSSAHDPVLYPAAAANVIGVGVVDAVNGDDLANFSLTYPQHSSSGPTADGRCKPDIVAPGNCLAADANQPNRYEPTGSWASFSTPIVAGTIGLLVQKAKQDTNLADAVSPNGGNCVIKAILLNSARKLPYWHKGILSKDDDHSVPLDYVQGAGLLDAVSAYKHLIAGPNKPSEAATIGWDLNQLDKNDNKENTYKITLPVPADKFITATVVWNKHYNSAYPFEAIPAKDVDLRLELWAIDPENRSNNYLLDYSDSGVDNVEHIYAAADANYTNYEIVVSYSNADEPNRPNTTQRYALAWNVSNRQDTDNILWYDLNSDGVADDSDIIVLLDNWLTSLKSPDSFLLGDINNNGTIDAGDLQIFLNHIKHSPE